MKSTAYKDELVPELVEGGERGEGNSDNDMEAYPYEYGFRYVEYTLPDGTQKIAEEPLTIEDILFPQEGDQVAHREDHNVTTSCLRDGMKVQGVQDPTLHVFDDVLIDFGVAGLPAMCPDVTMLKGDLDMDKLRSIVRVEDEDVEVVLVAEVTSPGTRHIDVPENMLNEAELRKLRREQAENPNVRSKFELYALAGIPLFVISDNARRKDRYTPPPFYVFRLNEAGEYEELERDDNGRVWIEEVGMALGQGKTDLAWFNDAGKELGTFVEMFLENERIKKELEELKEAKRLWLEAGGLDMSIVEKYTGYSLSEIDEEAKRLQLEEEEERAEQEREKALEEQRKAEQEREEEKRLRLEAEERAAQAAQVEHTKAIETARKMLVDGLDPSIIAKYTGLSTNDIAALTDASDNHAP